MKAAAHYPVIPEALIDSADKVFASTLVSEMRQVIAILRQGGPWTAEMQRVDDMAQAFLAAAQ